METVHPYSLLLVLRKATIMVHYKRVYQEGSGRTEREAAQACQAATMKPSHRAYPVVLHEKKGKGAVAVLNGPVRPFRQ